MMAAIGPHMQKYLWWKKYLTLLQMAQFVGIMVHAFQLFFSNPCNYPIVFSYWIGGHGVLFFFLFKNFYKQAYTPKSKRKDEKDINANSISEKNESCDRKQKEKFDLNGNHAIDNNHFSNGDALRNRITT